MRRQCGRKSGPRKKTRPLRRHRGQRPVPREKAGSYDASAAIGTEENRNPAPYDRSVDNRRNQQPCTPEKVSQRPDASQRYDTCLAIRVRITTPSGQITKPLRRHFGENYYRKKARNSQRDAGKQEEKHAG